MTVRTADDPRHRRRIAERRCALLATALIACTAAPGHASDVTEAGTTAPPAAPTADLGIGPDGPQPAVAAAAPARRASRSVYACDDAGLPTFSDRPCGPSAVARSLSVESGPGGESVRPFAPAPRASTRPLREPVAATGPGAPPRAPCASLARQLEELDDRMREGYSSREAARLWKRWRELRERLRTGRC